MANNTDFNKELIFASSDKSISYLITKAEKDRQIRKIAPRIYTSNLRDSADSRESLCRPYSAKITLCRSKSLPPVAVPTPLFA
jgi:hypothetical protein